ncbi:MAG: 4-(cytidine 5'-diphospho)-2-C-methyl-D-erythritol kinase [Verrucomicrobiota bacterium]
MPAVALIPRIARAYAKVNLSLEIKGQRSDGFHELSTVMTRVSLYDELLFEPRKEGGIEFVCREEGVPSNDENLVVRAARELEKVTGKSLSVRIVLRKQIPTEGGLGGGSSNAATTLRELNEIFRLKLKPPALEKVAARLGSDVPFFLRDCVCQATGRGEELAAREDDWELPVVLLKLPFGVPTPWAYQEWSGAKPLPGILAAPQICPWGPMVNDLEVPVFQKYLPLADMKRWLLEQPEVHAALLCGSGSTMLAILGDPYGGQDLAKRAQEEFGKSLWTWVGSTLPKL